MQSEKMLRILILEDNSEDIELIQRALRRDNLAFVSESVDTREEFTKAIESFEPDVILSDHGLPQFNSREALKICMKQRGFVPFILVTGTMSDEFAISCLREGADDYILKSNLSRLPSAIRRAVKERRLEKLKREARHALRKQNMELQKVNKELDSFVYSVSHNLRGPLASVMGLLNLAKDEDDKDKLYAVHKMMDMSLLKLDQTLREILDHSKNSRNPLEVSAIHWRELINAALDNLSYISNVQNVRINVETVDSIPFLSDGNRILVVLNCVLSNAFLYQTNSREPVVSIDVRTSEHEAMLVIEDNGIGISDEALPRIFQMFYRGTEMSKGAGLGLYIVKDVVAKLNGMIDVRSVNGEGTTVVLTIPRLEKQE